jgi:hypothetical protein
MSFSFVMKRSVDSANIQELFKDDGEPDSKVVLVEREVTPGGVALVSPAAVAKRSYIDFMELTEGVSNVSTAMQSNTRNKLEIIGRQMKNLQELMTEVFEETKLSVELHKVACNFVKKAGHIYHLYQRPSGQKYFGMLSPEEWQISPHDYLGSYRLEVDLSWTPATSSNGRYEGLHFLKQMCGLPHLQALM